MERNKKPQKEGGKEEDKEGMDIDGKERRRVLSISNRINTESREGKDDKTSEWKEVTRETPRL